jgi:hypothetical protein
MAIEFQIQGDFELAHDVKRAVLDALGEEGKEVPPAGERATFELWSPLVLVVGLRNETEDPDRRSTLYCRLDKVRVMEAIDVVIRCTAAVLDAIDDDVALRYANDLVELRRRGGQTRLYERSKPPESPFWTRERKAIIQERNGRARRRESPR